MYEKIIKQYDEACNMPTRPAERTYSADHIFDEEKSVKWNREEVIRRNAEIREHNIKIREQRFKALEEAHNNIINYLVKEYPTISKKKIENIYHWTYDDYMERYDHKIQFVIDKAEEILDIFSEEE